MTKIIYFGTQQFAASILEALILSKQYGTLAVVTQPDRPVGRQQKLAKSAVKLIAEKHNITILQPASLVNNSKIINLKSEINIVCQYGLIIPKNIINAPRYGSINIHASLLPKYRGASPIQTTIINGEIQTGISIISMDEKMDHGPILNQASIKINPNDTGEELSKKMEPLAAGLLLKTIPKYLSGNLKLQTQNEDRATYCKIFTRDDGKINWSKSAAEIFNLYRGLTPWPGVWTTWNGKRLKLLKIKETIKQTMPTSPLRRSVSEASRQENNKTIEQLDNRAIGQSSSTAGKIIVKENNIYICCGVDLIEIAELQLESKKALDAKTFINGYKNFNDSLCV